VLATGRFFMFKACLPIFLAIFCSSPAYASCLSGLYTSRESGFQPILECDTNDLSACSVKPHLLLILSIPGADISRDLSTLSSPLEYKRFFVALAKQTLQDKKYWRYTCSSTLGSPSNYTCYDSAKGSLVLSDYPVYKYGFPYQSFKREFKYTRFHLSSLPYYHSEYVCDPQDPSIVQLLQYHSGPDLKKYYKDGLYQYQNHTGSYSIVVRLSYFSKDSFKQKQSKKRKIGFTIDPASVGPVIDYLVPDSLR